MRFHTSSGARRWLTAHSLRYHPPVEPAHQYAIEDDGTDAREALLALWEGGGEVLVRLEDHPMTQSSRRKRLENWREEHGERRHITEAVAFIPRETEAAGLAEFLEIAVGRGSCWTVWFYFGEREEIVRVVECSVIDLWDGQGPTANVLSSRLPASGG